MSKDVNNIRNADFLRGRSAPLRWTWSATARGARWNRGVAGQAEEKAGVTIVCDGASGSAGWSQVVVCKPGELYRVEATVTCDLQARDECAGVVLEVQPVKDDKPFGQRLFTPALHRASEPIAIRTVYKAPDEVRRIKVSLGVVKARGLASIHHVRFIKILEPDEDCNVMAIPPAAFAVPPPRVVRSVCVCSQQAATRPITHLLTDHLGRGRVQSLRPGDLRPSKLAAGAVLLPDAMPSPAVRSMAALTRMAQDRIVIVSLPAFARLSNSLLSVRRIEQDDDPIHAQIVHASYATRGFALEDTFAYAWPGAAPGSFVQNQYRKTQAFKSFIQKHGLVTMMDSMCDQDSTSSRPIALYKPTPRGGLFVLDIEPAEAPASTLGEPVPAVHLLLSILGLNHPGLGQYVVPARTDTELRFQIRDMRDRFDRFKVHEPDLPIEKLAEQLVTIGRNGQASAVQFDPKPIILVRSGLTGGDVESVYGAFTWFKQLVRMAPFSCPYADQLAAEFQMAWLPSVAPLEVQTGWRRSGRPAAHPMTLGAALEGNGVSTIIDVVSRPINRVRVVFPSDNADYRRAASWLGTLADAFAPGDYCCLAVGEGEAFSDRDRFAWRRVRYGVEVVVDSGVTTDSHRELAADASCRRRGSSVGHRAPQVIRIEVPGHDADFTAYSIQRTDLVATLLEHVIGLQYGLLAVNRSLSPVRIDSFPPVEPGGALIVHRQDPMLRADASRAG